MVFNSVVKESCFKYLQGTITTYVHDVTTLKSLTTNLIPNAFFRFKVKSKKLYGQSCLTTGKNIFTVFCCRNVKVKRSKSQKPLHWTASILPTVNVANQKML